MGKIDWDKEHHILRIDPPRRPKKVTGTRFAAILGKNPWCSPFEVWCAICRVWEKPFTDNIYTNAGKIIEPKQAEYMEKSYGMSLLSPTDVYGIDYFDKTHGDFFPENSRYGGMWDYISLDENDREDAVLEMKTTKRIEDWKEDVPEYYALQAGLYAYLKDINDVIMVASFLNESDYEHPEDYKPNINNTITVPFKMSERYPMFALLINEANEWWKAHVMTGISPPYDEKRDAEVLAGIRTNTLTDDTNIAELLKEGETLKREIDNVTASIVDKEKRLKTINNMIREYAVNQFRPEDKKVEVKGNSYTWTISKTETTSVDADMLKQDGLYDKYSKVTPNYRLTVKEVKKDG